MAAKAPSVHLKDILADAGFTFGGAAEWSVWIGKQPTSPSRAITIYDSGGLAPNPKWLLDYPSVQIKMRGGPNDYDVVYTMARQVRDRLLGIASYTADNGDRIVHVNAIGDVAFTGWDDQSRPEFVFNFRMIIEPAPDAYTNREPL